MYNLQLSRKELFEKLRNSFAIMLAIVLAVGAAPVSGVLVYAIEQNDGLNAFTQDSNTIFLTEDQITAFEVVQEFNNFVGLVGFEDGFALPNDDTPVPVIVIFNSNPAPTQVIEAALDGVSLAIEEAIQIVEDEHDIFRMELANLFSIDGIRSGDYDITVEYRHTFSGVAMTLPANMAEGVAGLSVVQAILPDYPIDGPEVFHEDAAYALAAIVESLSAYGAGDNPWGTFQGRARMNADELHRRGIDGTGIIVAVLDSGIEWMHPAFAGSFPPAEVINEAREARFGGTNPTAFADPRLAAPLSQAELLNINVYDLGPYGVMGHPRAGEDPAYYFVGRDILRLWPGGGGNDLRQNPIYPGGTLSARHFPQTLPPGMPGNNPMEHSPLYFHNAAGQDMRHAAFYNLPGAALPPAFAAMSSHGTHVAGTIFGRAAGDDPGRAVLGVAPGAWGTHYRLLFDPAGTYCSMVLSGQEWAFLDGANVVQMSLGFIHSGAACIRSVAVNNLMLADPTIVFSISAGNSGTNFYTIGGPGGAQMAFTASAFTEPAQGLAIESSGFTGTGNATFVTARDNARVAQLENGNFVINHPVSGLVHNAGEFKIFPMPVLGTVDENNPVGQGTVAEFDALVSLHGAEALAGHFVLVRRVGGNETGPNLASRAAARGLGGVISVNTLNTAPQIINATGVNFDPAAVLQITHEEGSQWARNLAAPESPAFGTFRFTDTVTGTWGGWFTDGLPNVVNFSSRGPIELSFEIQPDFGAHGQNVFSAHPRWTAGAGGIATWRTNPWQNAYANSSGTSMSSPHIAGAVALLQHYSATRGTGVEPINAADMWANYEIKTRLQNTAIHLDYPGSNYSPFDGARQVDVLAAIETNTVVSVEFDRVSTDLFVPFHGQTLARTYIGTFSFGGFNRHASYTGSNPEAPPRFGERNIGERAGMYSLRAFIQNNSNTAITYTITSEMLDIPRPERPAGTDTARVIGTRRATIDHVTTLTVPAGQSRHFDVIMHIPAGSALGFHEGSVTVTGGSHDIVLPVAAVTHASQRAFEFLGLYRPVITTNRVGEGAQNITSNELIAYFRQDWGFFLDLYLICGTIVNNPLFNGENWFAGDIQPDGRRDLIFADYIMGTTMGTVGHGRAVRARHVSADRGVDRDNTMRAVIFDGYYIPHLSWETMYTGDRLETRRLEAEGDYFIGIQAFRQTSDSPTRGLWHYDGSYLVPFSVDNTPPVFNSLTINGQDVLGQVEDGIMSISTEEGEGLVIKGNVTDLWLEQAIEDQVRFGVWTGGRTASKENLGIMVGAHGTGSMSVFYSRLANIDGSFEIDLSDYRESIGNDVELIIQLIDGYVPVPDVNQVPIGSSDPSAGGAHWNQPLTARLWWELVGLEGGGLAGSVTTGLRSDVVPGRAGNNPVVNAIPQEDFNAFTFFGLNVTELTITINRAGAVNTTPLYLVIAEAEGLNQRDYTPQTWIHVMRALATARAMLMNPDATQAQINDAADRIQDAINNLEELVPPTVIVKDALHAAIAEAEGLIQADYTPQTWMHLMRSLATARAALGNPGVTQVEIDAAAAGIFSAINGLLPRL